MLTVSKASAGHASHYYTADNPGQSTLDSEWLGKAAEALELSGSVNPESFKQVISGIAPNGEALYQRRLVSRADGYDLTLSAPKSVSLLAVWKGDAVVRDAHRCAVRETFKQIEQEAQTRMMVDKKVRFIQTGNLAAAAFEHTLSRDNDPQLHTHVVIANVTRYRKKWCSFYARRVFTQIKKWGAFYRKKLSQLLVKAGYKLRAVGKGFWEVASVPPAVIEAFSKRRETIIKMVGESASSAQKQYACLSSRSSKESNSIVKLRKQWTHQVQRLSAAQSTKQQTRER